MTNSFLGIPIEGDIVYGERKPEQKPLEELTPLLQAVLDDDGVAAFGWKQYTPYFNDGDECVFGASQFWAARPEDLEDGDFIYSGDLELVCSGPWGCYEGGRWINNPDTPSGYPRIRVDATYVGPDKDRYDRLRALEKAIDSGSFDMVLLEAFGDHAEVTVKRDGITVDFYDHDLGG